MHHELKIRSEYYHRIETNEKTFEVRLNDRDYQKGDRLTFRIVSKNGRINYECEPITVEVVYVHTGLGMADGYVILGFKKQD
jgi:ASC-1-like (ASCH) protein